MKITVVGAGYVGLSLATLLSLKNKVNILEIVESKVDMINNRISPIADQEIGSYFKRENLNLEATSNYYEALDNSDLIVIATPTNYDEITHNFDTSSIEYVLDYISERSLEIPVIIKSTIPLGYTDKIKQKYKKSNICFSPEFLREGKALYDNLYPSRIIVGSSDKYALTFANLLRDASLNKNVEILTMSNKEAEAVKLFSNTYLAMRVSFFNELDTFAEINDLNTHNIIKGVSLDPRIGEGYNNPSFGYGGYCLPKDTKQLLSNFKDIPQTLVTAIVNSNQVRKEHIATQLINKNPKTVGIYRLTMKKGSDNFRDSAVFDIMNNLKNHGVEIIVYEPTISDKSFKDFKIENEINTFIDKCDIILSNRIDNLLKDYSHKVYTRDIFNEN